MNIVKIYSNQAGGRINNIIIIIICQAGLSIFAKISIQVILIGLYQYSAVLLGINIYILIVYIA